MRTGKRALQAGFTYLAVIVAMFMLTSVSLVVAQMWVTATRREAERELLFVGQEIRCAIARYYERGPGAVKRYPASLDELLEDKRFLVPMRHLRKLYADPVTRGTNWLLIRAPEGGVMGVASSSTDTPIKQARFDDEFGGFEDSDSFADWQFVYRREQAAVVESCFGHG